MSMTASVDGATYTIAEASNTTNTPADTLRYYERAGVIPHIARTGSGQRAYTDDDIGWIIFVRRLRATGMSMQNIAEYAAMVRAGDGTIIERRRLLESHRASVAAAIEELTMALEVLDRKLAHYGAAERGVDLDCSDQPSQRTRRLSMPNKTPNTN